MLSVSRMWSMLGGRVGTVWVNRRRNVLGIGTITLIDQHDFEI